MEIKTLVFLGAGASKSEGVPLQNELFVEYFNSSLFQIPNDINRRLRKFFKVMFGINVAKKKLKASQFPTFEEVLTLTDLALARNETFASLGKYGFKYDEKELQLVSQSLIFMMAQLVGQRAEGHGRSEAHRMLVNNLRLANKLQATAFLSTNYDIFIDNALTEMHEYDIDLDYGIRFQNFDNPDDWCAPNSERAVYLFKPHGSLNWLLCSTCNEVLLTPKEKGVLTRSLVTQENARPCPRCGTRWQPLIVPPTYYKDMSNVFLSTIWNRAENSLKTVEHVVFCGYSFPDADSHIKYLLKRIQLNRAAGSISPLVHVVNGRKPRGEPLGEIERSRFKRFFGKNMHFTDMDFQEFCQHPSHVIG